MASIDLKQSWSKDTDPLPHEHLMALAFLIYDLNKCAVAMTELNVKDCTNLMNVVKSICRHDDEYLNLYDSLPTTAVETEFAKINKKEIIYQDLQKEGEAQKKLVEEMKTVEDLRIILVQLVTEAKSEKASSQPSGHFHTITTALDLYNWSAFKPGK